ncbi:ANK_REP_REGION domain-containing protein [Haematococcus lacustris]|uniref:ANK_REP_REGION domain-containing protein n=1 Tax=Haematococcus lacustris TaxID=44745 RepID=A0A6A0AF98_HAELA|nr:ANK_REP_REGION domain-containing protein [Haematococcus lacustris]
MTGASGSDLLQAVKNGTPEMVAHALGSARQLGNRPSACKSWPLHMAVWRNHPPIVALLLEAGCGVDCADAESGW